MFILKSRAGQGMVEYMILVALIAAGTVGIIRVSDTTSAPSTKTLIELWAQKPTRNCRCLTPTRPSSVKKTFLTF